MQNHYGDHSFARFVALGIPLLLNAALCLLDEQQLKRAGYAGKWLTIFGVILAPAYPFLRAKRLRQTMIGRPLMVIPFSSAASRGPVTGAPLLFGPSPEISINRLKPR